MQACKGAISENKRLRSVLQQKITRGQAVSALLPDQLRQAHLDVAQGHHDLPAGVMLRLPCTHRAFLSCKAAILGQHSRGVPAASAVLAAASRAGRTSVVVFMMVMVRGVLPNLRFLVMVWVRVLAGLHLVPVLVLRMLALVRTHAGRMCCTAEPVQSALRWLWRHFAGLPIILGPLDAAPACSIMLVLRSCCRGQSELPDAAA